MNENQLPIPRTTLTEMVAAYRQAEVDIRCAYALLTGAEERLKAAFQSDAYAFDLDAYSHRSRSLDYTKPEQTMHELKHAAWKVLVDKMGIRSAMSIQRAKELDEQLAGRTDRFGHDVEPLPEITEANILAMMESTLGNLGAMLEEAVLEVFDWLMPRNWRLEYKTNQKSQWELKEKLILTCCIQRSHSRNTPYQVNYYRQQNITALDNVFAMMDGKGIVKTHYGPLTDAICASADGTGETEYFAFKCFGNGNLHLKFKRPDLVAKLNAVAGGMRLKDIERKEAA
jgi:hypothetical protein